MSDGQKKKTGTKFVWSRKSSSDVRWHDSGCQPNYAFDYNISYARYVRIRVRVCNWPPIKKSLSKLMHTARARTYTVRGRLRTDVSKFQERIDNRRHISIDLLLPVCNLCRCVWCDNETQTAFPSPSNFAISHTFCCWINSHNVESEFCFFLCIVEYDSAIHLWTRIHISYLVQCVRARIALFRFEEVLRSQIAYDYSTRGLTGITFTIPSGWCGSAVWINNLVRLIQTRRVWLETKNENQRKSNRIDRYGWMRVNLSQSDP